MPNFLDLKLLRCSRAENKPQMFTNASPEASPVLTLGTVIVIFIDFFNKIIDIFVTCSKDQDLTEFQQSLRPMSKSNPTL